jgi:hypothetical protein
VHGYWLFLSLQQNYKLIVGIFREKILLKLLALQKKKKKSEKEKKTMGKEPEMPLV